jgi:hypothetical protein
MNRCQTPMSLRMLWIKRGRPEVDPQSFRMFSTLDQNTAKYEQMIESTDVRLEGTVSRFAGLINLSGHNLATGSLDVTHGQMSFQIGSFVNRDQRISQSPLSQGNFAVQSPDVADGRV